MTIYYNKVNDLLGEKFVGKLHQHAANMSHTDMEEFAKLLDDRVRGVTKGGHTDPELQAIVQGLEVSSP